MQGTSLSLYCNLTPARDIFAFAEQESDEQLFIELFENDDIFLTGTDIWLSSYGSIDGLPFLHEAIKEWMQEQDLITYCGEVVFPTQKSIKEGIFILTDGELRLDHIELKRYIIRSIVQ